MKFLKNKINLIVSLLISIMLVLILFSSQRENKTKIEGVIGNTLTPIQKILYTLTKNISDTYKGIVNRSELVGKIENLLKENGELKTKISLYDQLKTENDRLREILNFKDKFSNYKFIGANVIGKNGAYIDEFIIDIGIKDGLNVGMVVIANGGLFGMITSVSDNWSLVSPLINGDIAVSGVILRTNMGQGIIKGNVSNEYNLKMEYLFVDEDVKIGDIVVTSGLAGVYPSDIPIGQVVNIESDKRNLSKSVFLKSHVEFDFVKELFVIVPRDTSGVKY